MERGYSPRIMAKTFPELLKDMNPQIQKYVAFRGEKSLLKLQNSKLKMLKASREKERWSTKELRFWNHIRFWKFSDIFKEISNSTQYKVNVLAYVIYSYSQWPIQVTCGNGNSLPFGCSIQFFKISTAWWD